MNCEACRAARHARRIDGHDRDRIVQRRGGIACKVRRDGAHQAGVDRMRAVEPHVTGCASATGERPLQPSDGERVLRERDPRSEHRLAGHPARLGVDARAPRDGRVSDARVESLGRIWLEDFRGKHGRRAASHVIRCVRERVEQHPTRAEAAGARAHDERSDFARGGRRTDCAAVFEPPLHLAAGRPVQVRHEVHMAAEDRVTSAYSRVLVEPGREMRVCAVVERAGVAAPSLVSVPQFAPKRGDRRAFAGNRGARHHAHRLSQRGHRSPMPAGKSSSTRSSTSP